MFSAEDILRRIKEPPFLPLRIVTTTGTQYEVHHPDLVMVGERYLMIGHATAKNPSVFDQVTRVAMIHVAELQDIVSSQPPEKNAELN